MYRLDVYDRLGGYSRVEVSSREELSRECVALRRHGSRIAKVTHDTKVG